MTRQQIIKLVWSEWSNSTSFASTVSWEFILLSARKSIIFSARSFSSSASSVQETRKFFISSSASSSLRSSFARNLQRFFTQIASLFSVSSILSSIFSTISLTWSSARDARDLHRKLMQRFSVSSSCFSSRIYFSHDSSRSSSRYSSAWDSRWTLTRNVSVFLSRSSA